MGRSVLSNRTPPGDTPASLNTRHNRPPDTLRSAERPSSNRFDACEQAHLFRFFNNTVSRRTASGRGERLVGRCLYLPQPSAAEPYPLWSLFGDEPNRIGPCVPILAVFSVELCAVENAPEAHIRILLSGPHLQSVGYFLIEPDGNKPPALPPAFRRRGCSPLSRSLSFQHISKLVLAGVYPRVYGETSVRAERFLHKLRSKKGHAHAVYPRVYGETSVRAERFLHKLRSKKGHAHAVYPRVYGETFAKTKPPEVVGGAGGAGRHQHAVPVLQRRWDQLQKKA